MLILIIFLLILYFSKSSFANIKQIDVVYYINLDERSDRNKEILDELKKIDYPKNKIVRIPAIKKVDKGHLGCSISHMNAVQKFIKSGLNNCIIFEDDFQFIESSETVNKCFSDLLNSNINYDVVFLAYFDVQSKDSKYPFLRKIISGQASSGYLLNKKFAQTLLKNMKEGISLFEKDYTPPKYAVDQYWKKIQPNNNWYAFIPKLGKQRISYSDTDRHEAIYNY